MLLRKSRRHLHGASNRQPTEATFYAACFKPASAPKHLALPPKLNLTTSHFTKHPNPLRKSHEAGEGQGQSRGEGRAVSRLEGQLRKMYQGRRSIVKAMEGWGFDARGFISSAAFAEKLGEKLGREPEGAEVQLIIQKYCKSAERVDAKELIALLHGRSEGSLFNETLFSPAEASKHRQHKINNLKENSGGYLRGARREMDCSTMDSFLFKVNSGISKMRDLTEGRLASSKEEFFEQLAGLAEYGECEQQALRRVAGVADYEEIRYNIQSHSSVDHLFLDPILRRTHTKLQHRTEGQEGGLFINKMAKSATSSHLGFRDTSKGAQFDPKAMLNINQQKTRFGMSKFTQQSEQRPVLLREGVSPNQKELILESIKSEADLHKQRYQNKLEKLRMLQRREGESVARREEEAEQRDRGRVERVRHEQEAYNYVNFIKKNWE